MPSANSISTSGATLVAAQVQAGVVGQLRQGKIEPKNQNQLTPSTELLTASGALRRTSRCSRSR